MLLLIFRHELFLFADIDYHCCWLWRHASALRERCVTHTSALLLLCCCLRYADARRRAPLLLPVYER